MQQRIEHAIKEALQARRRADACVDTRLREQWLYVADAWERVARAFEHIQKLRDDALLAAFKARPVGVRSAADAPDSRKSSN